MSSAFKGKKKNRMVKRRRKNGTVNLVGKGSIVPKSMITELKYAHPQRRATGLSNHYVYRVNSTFDPDYTGTGHQPMGRDQYMGLYQRAQVLGFKIIVTSTSNSASGVTAPIHTMWISDTVNDVSSLSEAQENKNAITWKNATSDAGIGNLTKSYKASLKRLIGRSFLDNDWAESISGNPTRQLYLHLRTDPAVSGQSIDVSIDVRIHYIVKFFEPSEIGPS